MKTLELVRQHAAIKHLIKRAGHDPSTKNIEMLAHWGRYLCVLTAGYVENVVRHVYGDYLAKASGKAQVARYARRFIEGVQNPKAGKLVEIATSFEPKWGADLEAFLDQNLRGEAINSIMQNRHLIAHGRNSDISIARVDQYIGKIAEVAAFIEQQCEV
jgi:hypothetical protein